MAIIILQFDWMHDGARLPGRNTQGSELLAGQAEIYWRLETGWPWSPEKLVKKIRRYTA